MGVAASLAIAEKISKACEGLDATDSLPVVTVCFIVFSSYILKSLYGLPL